MSQGTSPRRVTAPGCTPGRQAAALVIFVLLGLSAGCGGGAGVGHECAERADCRTGLQCLAGICTPTCSRHDDCGDGYTCSDDGECAAVTSQIGDACVRELDCGPGQACQIEAVDGDGDSILVGTCQTDRPGGGTGGDCQEDAGCRNGICALGRCTELCATDDDCPGGDACVAMPRLLPNSAPLFRGCMQNSGVLELELATGAPHADLRIPVPENAISFAMIASTDDETQLVGASRVTSPSGALLYATPFSPDEFYENPLRHQPEAAISTLLVPNTPAIEIETGVYEIEVDSFFPAGGLGTAIPEVTVVYKLAPATTLDLHFHFLDLTDHPCPDADGITAEVAMSSAAFRGYVTELQRILGQADIAFGDMSYHDISRPDLDGLRLQDLPRLGRLTTEPSGLHIFFTRSIVPLGVQAIAGGRPAPPGMPGTPASAIAVATDTLCYRTWNDLARATAHEMGRSMGLFRNREPDGNLDPIPDTGSGSDNLMFFSEFGGTQLTAGQIQVLQSYPGLR